MPAPVHRDEAPRLFLVVLGGRAAQCHVELHDVRWVVGSSIDATIPELKRQWFGLRRGLHIDSYVELRCVDGHTIHLLPRGCSADEPTSTAKPEPNAGQKLWFVNMGGYDPRSLLELHQCGCLVASSAQAAKSRAKRRWLRDSAQPHKDDLHAVDNVGGVDNCLPIDQLQGWQIHLEPTPGQTSTDFMPDWFGYRPI